MLSKLYKKILLSIATRFDDIVILIQKLRPSTYLKNLRITELNDSEINEGDNVCIFIIYERLNIPAMTWNAIHAIKNMGIKVFVVVNSKLEQEEQAKVRDVADISMFRRNTGKDIGAYKDAYLHLLEKGDLKKINRLIFANDSVVYPAKFTNELFQKLVNDPSNMVGYSHVQEIHYHIQSFLFSCDHKLINDKLFIKFWKQYLPIDRRRYMIHKGEVGITKTVLKTGKKIKVLNTIAALLSNTPDLDKLVEMSYSLPTRSLSHVPVIENLNTLIKSQFFALPNHLRNIRVNLDDNLLLELNRDISKYKKILSNQYVMDLVNLIGARNNTHWNTFIFLELGLPVIVKRDSVYRAGYDYDYFSHYIRKYFAEESEEILGMLKSPASTHFKGIKRIMFDNGII